MSLERKPELHLEVAHVLFMDVVGFSKLLINDQSEILEQLNRLVRETPHFREAEATGKLIRLATGDGMALVFSNSAEAPIECALEISKALQSYPQIQLRMGVHSGPVNAVSDVNDRSNVTGAGINLAQRVMDCDAAHILLFRQVLACSRLKLRNLRRCGRAAGGLCLAADDRCKIRRSGSAGRRRGTAAAAAHLTPAPTRSRSQLAAVHAGKCCT